MYKSPYLCPVHIHASLCDLTVKTDTIFTFPSYPALTYDRLFYFMFTGKVGKQCYQNDECLSSPCPDDRVCKNRDFSSGSSSGSSTPGYECVCADSDTVCKDNITNGPTIPPMHIVYISGKIMQLSSLLYQDCSAVTTITVIILSGVDS